MKKKKIISILSSILCSFAFVGLFAIGLFVEHKQKATETKADSNVIISEGSYSNSFVSTFDSNLTFNFGYNFEYYRTIIQGENKYQIHVIFSNLSYDFLQNGVVNHYDLDIYRQGESTISNEYYSNLFESLDNQFNLQFDRLYYFANYVGGQLISNGYGSALEFEIVNGNNTLMNLNLGLINTSFVYPHTPTGTIDYFTVDFLGYHLLETVVNVLEEDSYQAGYSDGYNQGYNQGYSDGSVTSYNQGYEQGASDGSTYQHQQDEQLFDDYYNQGFSEGYELGHSEDATVSSIFSGITTVALVPIKFFLSVFNFEILGVNIASVVSALMSICLILIIWRAIMGGKSND